MAKKKKDIGNDSYSKLTAYINKIANGNVNWPMVTATIKRYTKDDMTYSGIQYCLWYMIVIKDISWYNLGLVPYYYDEAKKYWNDMQKIKNSFLQSSFVCKQNIVEFKEVDDRRDIFK